MWTQYVPLLCGWSLVKMRLKTSGSTASKIATKHNTFGSYLETLFCFGKHCKFMHTKCKQSIPSDIALKCEA